MDGEFARGMQAVPEWCCSVAPDISEVRHCALYCRNPIRLSHPIESHTADSGGMAQWCSLTSTVLSKFRRKCDLQALLHRRTAI